MNFVQMLTILGSLGIVGAACTYFFNSFREHRQNRRERNGLARLLYHEMEGNRILLSNLVCEISDEMLVEKLRSEKCYLRLATGVWEAARIRVAQLFRTKEFHDICDYYMSLRSLTDYIQEHLCQSDKTDLDEALKRANYTRSRVITTNDKYLKIRCRILKRYTKIDSATETGADPVDRALEHGGQ